MPDLSTTLHVSMLRVWRTRKRLGRFFRRLGLDIPILRSDDVYGYQWGDPEKEERLIKFRSRFLTPFIDPSHRAVEIGPGGGRWTRYLLDFEHAYAVDYYAPLLEELSQNLTAPNLTLVKNNGSDFPEIPKQSIDYVLSFGTFVHLEPNIIEDYLRSIAEILKPGGDVVIQYSDVTKPAARKLLDKGFSDNDPERMRAMVQEHGYRIVGEDLESFGHSSIIHITR